MISRTSGANRRVPALGRIIFTNALFDFIGPQFKDVPFRLGDADLFQFRPLAGKRRAPIALQTAADFKRQVFRGGDAVAKGIGIEIQIAVVERRQHLSLHQVVQAPGRARRDRWNRRPDRARSLRSSSCARAHTGYCTCRKCAVFLVVQVARSANGARRQRHSGASRGTRLLSEIIDKQIGRFVKAHGVQPTALSAQVRLETPPDFARDIFRRGHDAVERRRLRNSGSGDRTARRSRGSRFLSVPSDRAPCRSPDRARPQGSLPRRNCARGRWDWRRRRIDPRFLRRKARACGRRATPRIRLCG